MPYCVWVRYRGADLAWDRYLQSRSRGAPLMEFYGGLVGDLRSFRKLVRLILLNAQTIFSSRIKFSKAVKYFSDHDPNQLTVPGGCRSAGMHVTLM